MSRGAPKAPVTYAGTWDSTRTYLPLQIVTEDGAAYMSIAVSTGVTPSSDPTAWLPFGGGAPASRMSVHASQLVTDGMLATKASLTELEAPSSTALELAPPSGGMFFDYDRIVFNTAGVWTISALWHLDTDIGDSAVALELLTSITPSPIASLYRPGDEASGFLSFTYYFPAGGSCGLALNQDQYTADPLPDVTVDVDLYVTGPV